LAAYKPGIPQTLCVATKISDLNIFTLWKDGRQNQHVDCVKEHYWMWFNDISTICLDKYFGTICEEDPLLPSEIIPCPYPNTSPGQFYLNHHIELSQAEPETAHFLHASFITQRLVDLERDLKQISKLPLQDLLGLLVDLNCLVHLQTTYAWCLRGDRDLQKPLEMVRHLNDMCKAVISKCSPRIELMDNIACRQYHRLILNLEEWFIPIWNEVFFDYGIYVELCKRRAKRNSVGERMQRM
jgi:hypothetical protein